MSKSRSPKKLFNIDEEAKKNYPRIEVRHEPTHFENKYFRTKVPHPERHPLRHQNTIYYKCAA